MNIFWMLVIGLIVGILAKTIMPKWYQTGVIATIPLGIIGSLLAGYGGESLGWYQEFYAVPGFVTSIFGAMLLLFLYQVIIGRFRIAT